MDAHGHPLPVPRPLPDLDGLGERHLGRRDAPGVALDEAQVHQRDGDPVRVAQPLLELEALPERLARPVEVARGSGTRRRGALSALAMPAGSPSSRRSVTLSATKASAASRLPPPYAFVPSQLRIIARASSSPSDSATASASRRYDSARL